MKKCIIHGVESELSFLYLGYHIPCCEHCMYNYRSPEFGFHYPAGVERRLKDAAIDCVKGLLML